jgi:glycerol 2-dehydrogenase (NADP+)
MIDPETALNNSLKRLQLNYVDLFLNHWPSCKNYDELNKYKLIPIKETWEKMEKLVLEGKTKSIGVSNYNVQNLINIL